MKQFKLQRKSIHILFALAITIVMIGSNFQQIIAQTNAPQFPLLSVSGGDGYNDRWYPDSRIWTSYAHNGEKELLIPIFMDNSKWKNYPVPNPHDPLAGDTVLFDAKPIKSFQFSLLYHKNALEFVGFTTDHPKVFVDAGLPYTDEDEPCLAEGFDISASPQRTNRYMSYIRDPIPTDLQNGMQVKVVASSSNLSLPETSGWQILMYLKFKVLPTQGNFGTGSAVSQIIIDNDTIRYNNRIATKELPFIEQRPYSVKANGDNFYEVFYPLDKTPPNPYYEYWMDFDDDLFPGLAGMNNYKLSPNYMAFNEPVLPGMIYLYIKDQVPPLEFNINRFIGQSPAVGPLLDDGGNEILSEEGWKVEWEIKDPITADDENFTIGSRICEVRIDENMDGLIMKHITVKSSEEWLEFKPVIIPGVTRRAGLNSGFSRKGTMNWLDKGTLTNSQLSTMEAPPTGDGKSVQLEIQCDASKLAPAEGDEENNGIYTGYITFESPEMLNSPVRLKVTFIYFKSAQEGTLNVNNDTHGMKLTISNSRGIVGDAVDMVFGTGDRATNGVDTLYGEHAFDVDISGFGARFYPLDKNGNAVEDFGDDEQTQQDLLVANGFGDWSATDETPHTTSRDIRSSADTNQSIIYYVKFKEDGDDNYPIVVKWNTNDFLPGAQLFIRDTENGQVFPSVSMWDAEKHGNGVQTFAIQDPNVDDFLIEYTLPKVIEYLDENDMPIIKQGWNLLSLPVKPINTQYDKVYQFATILPIRYRNNVPQAESILEEGVGYFVKFAAQVDKQFAGTYINEISLDKGNAPRVYPGWNTVGALSVPVATSEITFDPFMGSPTPTTDHTELYGVWGYTNGEGYDEVFELLPGLGYWINVDGNGYYSVETDLTGGGSANKYNQRQEIYDNSEVISIKDNGQNHGKLYLSSDENISYNEMPPKPLEAMFDVRFNRGSNIDNAYSTVISMQAISYPITLSIDDARYNYTFFDAMSGKELGIIQKGTSGNVEIASTLADQVKVIKSAVSSAGGYNNVFDLTVAQNPVVNANVKISFTLPKSSFVTLSLYDNIGNKVADISSQNYSAGSHNINNAYDYFSTLPNGQYILKMNAGANSSVTKVIIMK